MNKKILIIFIILIAVFLIVGIELFFFQGIPESEVVALQSYRSEELGIEFQYPLNWEEPEIKEEDYSIIIEYIEGIKYISISSINQEKERIKQGVIRGKGGTDLLNESIKEALEKTSREIEIIEEIAKTGEISSHLEEEIKSYFSLMSKSKDEKFAVESIYLNNLDLWGLKLIGMDSPQISPCAFYYRFIFIINDKIVKIYFDKIEAIPGYSCYLPNYEEFVNNYDHLRRDYKEVLEEDRVSKYNIELAKKFETYNNLIRSIEIEEKEKVEEEWSRYGKDQYGIEFQYLKKYQSYSIGPDDRGESGFIPSYETIIFEDKDGNDFQMSVFWRYHKELSERNYEDDYMIYTSGLCDKNRGFFKELSWIDSFNGNKVLIVQGRRDNIPLNCYYFKNKDDKLVVFSLYNAKMEEVITNLNFLEEDFKTEGVYKEYNNGSDCLVGWVRSGRTEEGPGYLSCVYTDNDKITDWKKMTKEGREDYSLSFYQAINTPSEAFEINFDYIFPTKSGILTITIDSVVIRRIYAEELKTGHHYNFKETVIDNSLLDLENAILKFWLSGPEGSEVLITDIDVYKRINW